MQRRGNSFDGVPSGWRNFIEIKFKVSNVSSKTEAAELRELFASYGDVHRIEIETNDNYQSKGIVHVTYKPVPPIPFWKKPVRFHGRILQVDYQSGSSNVFFDQADKKPKLKFHSFRAKSLEMGVFLNPDTFVSEIKYIDLIKFIINYQKRSIRVEFDVHDCTFRLEVGFKDVEKIHTEHEESRGSITIANKFPAKYWVLDKRLQPKNKFSWCLEDSWKRKTEVRSSAKSQEEKEIPLQPHMPDNSEQLGKWVVFRITFDLNQIGSTPAEGIDLFKGMVKKAAEYNLVKSIDTNNNPLNIVNGTNLRKYVERSMLDFDVLYMVECNLSFNFLHDYNLNENFISLLSQQPSQSAIYILNAIHAGKKRIYDPSSYLHAELKAMKLNSIEIKPNHIPSYCVMMRKVVITPTTMYMLPPAMETSNRVIRRFRDKKDNFLRIQFTDEASNRVGSSYGTSNFALYNRIYRTLTYGIKIGDRHYEFLAFSSSQLRDHSCWFFASTKDLIASEIRGWMGDFSGNHNVAKYAARMGQCFSSTRDIQKLPVNNLEEIPDIIDNGYTFSDGIGKLSFLLAGKIAKELELKIIPSAFQFRLAGYKGMLCQSRFARNDQIQVRPSQHKFESNHNVLEVIRWSTFIPAYLNRQAITLLSTLGVPDKVFIDMVTSQVNELDKMLENESTAAKTLQKNIDEHGISKSLADLVRAGFLQTNDRYLVNLISLFRITVLRDLKRKAKIRVEKGAFLLGVLDDTQSLKENQVYCCISDPNNPSSRKVITGTCAVWRNPCFHPGDIRMVTAVNCKDLSNLVNVIVFPAVGYRDIPSQCSGGDLDGDDFTLIYDMRLIPKRKDVKPMIYEAQVPQTVDRVTMKDIKSFFVNYILSDQLGMIANAHLAKADALESGAFHGQCIRLAQLHSEAVDFPKTGRPAIFPPELRVSSFPDFMDKPDKESYESKKVLGILYRSIKVVEEFKPCDDTNFDERLKVEGYETYLKDARMRKFEYDTDIRGLMNQFGIKTEFEVVSGYIVNPVTKVDRKKTRDIAKSVMDALVPIRRHYRKVFEEEFYGEGTNVVSPVARSRMESKAYAWYYVTYHPDEVGDDPSENMISFPWIIHEVLCNIAIRNNKNNDEERNESIEVSVHQPTARKRNNKNTVDVVLNNDDDFTDANDDGMERLRRSINQG